VKPKPKIKRVPPSVTIADADRVVASVMVADVSARNEDACAAALALHDAVFAKRATIAPLRARFPLPFDEFWKVAVTRRRSPKTNGASPLVAMFSNVWPDGGRGLQRTDRELDKFNVPWHRVAWCVALGYWGPATRACTGERRRKLLALSDRYTEFPGPTELADIDAILGHEDDGFPLDTVSLLTAISSCAASHPAFVEQCADPQSTWHRLISLLPALDGPMPTEQRITEIDAALNTGTHCRLDPFRWADTYGSVRRVPCAVDYEVDDLVLSVMLNLHGLVTLAARYIQPDTMDPVFWSCVAIEAALVQVACERFGVHEVDTDAIETLVASCAAHSGSSATGLARIADPQVREVTAAVMRSMRGILSYSVFWLPRADCLRQEAALQKRYGVLRTPRDSWLLLCTRCKAPHSVAAKPHGTSGKKADTEKKAAPPPPLPSSPPQRASGAGANKRAIETEGCRDVRFDLLTEKLMCNEAVKYGTRAFLFPLQLLGCVVGVQDTCYGICERCGNRTVVDIQAHGYTDVACVRCRTNKLAIM